MTAAFDATPGTDQRFTDALSGSDGTADPSVMMPVLDVYPDALSAPMPVELLPVLVPVVPPPGRPGVRADPILGPGARAGAGPTPAQQRMAARRPAPQRVPQRPAPRPAAPRPASPQHPVAPRPPVTGARPPVPAAVQPAPYTFTWQGRTMSTTDLAAMVRSSLAGGAGQVDRESFQATHPQSMGSASPSAVAPAAPMASQYSARGQVRNDARNRSQERRRTSSTVAKKGSSLWAVIVFLFVIGFATGIVQKVWDLISGLLNR